MRMALRLVVVFSVVVWLTPYVRSQEPPKPGPEHEQLKQAEGTWEATVKMGPRIQRDDDLQNGRGWFVAGQQV
jgi:hypothetical protein